MTQIASVTVGHAALNGTLSTALGASPLVAAGAAGLGAGFATLAVGCGVEALLQVAERRLEAKAAEEGKEVPLKYQILTQGTRGTLVVGGGVLTTVAAVGLIGGLAATFAVASCGVALVVVGLAGIGFAIYRHYQKKKLKTFQGLADALLTLEETVIHQQIKAFAKSKDLQKIDGVYAELGSFILQSEGESVLTKLEKIKKLLETQETEKKKQRQENDSPPTPNVQTQTQISIIASSGSVVTAPITVNSTSNSCTIL